MRKLSSCFLGLLLVVPLSAAERQATLVQEPSKGKLILETWDAAYLDGNKAGYVHTTAHEFDRDGKKIIRTNVVLDLTLKRFEDTLNAHMERSTDESADGVVTGVGMSQSLGRQQVMVLSGTVTGKELHVKVAGRYKMDKKIPWNDQVIGLYREQNLFKERKTKPGDAFKYLQYEPGFNAVFNVAVQVKNFEDVAYQGARNRLLRVETVADKIQGVQPPPSTYWLDKDLSIVRFETEMPSLGKLVLERATKEAALAPSKPSAKVTDIGQAQLIPIGRIPQPNETTKVVYKITLKGDTDAGTAFARDSRQEVRNANGETFELHVKSIRGPQKVEKPTAKAPEEFLKSNYFINSDDPGVKDLARKAVDRATDDWQKAKQIELWVRKNMKVLNFSEAMATADHVARTREGDCTEFAMLTAAMCRAVGVPSRTAIGLVYVDNTPKGPALAYHMWTEVWVSGQWVSLDAVLGQGYVGATHLKITDHSWYDTESLKPLLPIMRVTLKKPVIEVQSVEGKK